MPKPRVVVFLDANVNPGIKEELGGHPVEVVLLKKYCRKMDDARLLEYFQQEAASKYAGALICILTHDQNFEKDAGYKLNTPIAIIKIPQAPRRSELGRLILASLKLFFTMSASVDRLSSLSGIIKFE